MAEIAEGTRVNHRGQRDACLAKGLVRHVAEGTVIRTDYVVQDNTPCATVEWDDVYVGNYPSDQLAPVASTA